MLSFEVLLGLLSQTARGVDLVKAFAGDVGAISSLVAALRGIPQALEVMRKASELEPAPTKTQLVLLAPRRPELVVRAEAAMASLAVTWCSMRLRTSATYLGAVVGPSAGAECWTAPLKKWRTRIDQMLPAPVPATPRLTQYRLRALPVLAYTAQLRAPPEALRRLERAALERLLKMPHNAVPTAVLAPPPEVGKPAPRAAHCLRLAALARAAATSSVRQRMLGALGAAREAHLPLAAFAQRRPSVPAWDNHAMVDTWAEVLEGSPELAAATEIVRDTMAAGGCGLQARLLADTTAAARTLPVAAALCPRINRLLAGVGQPPIAEAHFAAMITSLPGSPPALAVAALRTWVGAWSTPACQQHEPDGCPFGCSPPIIGNMKHIVVCETLRALRQRQSAHLRWRSLAALQRLRPRGLRAAVSCAQHMASWSMRSRLRPITDGLRTWRRTSPRRSALRRNSRLRLLVIFCRYGCGRKRRGDAPAPLSCASCSCELFLILLFVLLRPECGVM